MGNKKELVKARILVYCSQASVADCSVFMIAHRLGYSTAYVNQLVRELELESALHRQAQGKGSFVTALSHTAVEEAKKFLAEHSSDQALCASKKI